MRHISDEFNCTPDDSLNDNDALQCFFPRYDVVVMQCNRIRA